RARFSRETACAWNRSVRNWRLRTGRRALSQQARLAEQAHRRAVFVLPRLGQVRLQPLAGGLSVAICEFHEVRLAVEIALAGNAIDEVIGGLHTVTGRGKFPTQMICPLDPGIFLAASNEANPGGLDIGNQLIDLRLRLRIKRQRDRSGEQADEDGSEKLPHESTFRFGHDAQSSHSTGSQLITWASMRFMRPASG